MVTIELKTGQKIEMIDITSRINQVIRSEGISKGLCCIYVPHTTAGITINENADPNVVKDILDELNRLVPIEGPYKHMEGNAAAHIKSSLVGASQTVIVEDGRLVLGTWQAVFFCEFDGPRTRKTLIKLIREG